MQDREAARSSAASSSERVPIAHAVPGLKDEHSFNSPIINRKLCIQLKARRPGSVHQDEPKQAKAKTAAVACADALWPADACLVSSSGNPALAKCSWT